jgi:D-alanyl-D-alanine carboxypeptidase (penicillin-binding protein 5/6)
MFNAKRRLAVRAAMIALVSALASPALAHQAHAADTPRKSTAAVTTPDPFGRAVYLLDATTGKVRLDKNGTRPMPIASLTKVMTAYVVRQEAKLTDTVEVTRADVRYAEEGGGTSADLRPGDRLTVKELLYGLMLPSGADAAHALARVYGPGVGAFTDKMNATARRLGLKDTRYINADGLPGPGSDGQSTARDQARLAEVALRDKTLAAITSTARFRLPATDDHPTYVWKNTNAMLGSPGALGVKTGFTNAAGFCLAFAADRRGHRLIGVILGEEVSSRRFSTARSLIDWATP